MRFAMLLLMLLAIPTVLGATLTGSIYDYSLNPLDNIRVDINTTPKQTVVSVDGAYEFDLPPGVYELKASQVELGRTVAKAQETITIESDGEFVLDLLLFPVVDEELLNFTEVTLESPPEEKTSWLAILLVVGIFFAFLFILYYTWQAKKTLKETEKPTEMEILFSVEDKIIELLKKEGGGMTQREIRKLIPMSEAKISLAISGLAADERITKLKVGRGNIIKLK